MKILFLVTHLQSGGAERTVSYITKYLADNGMDVTILSFTDRIFYKVDEKVKVEVLGIPIEAKNITERLSNMAKRFRRVHKYLKKNKQDVVFCMLPELARYVLKNQKKQGFKLITSERNNPAIVTDKKTVELKNKIYNLSDGIVFQTQRALEYYSDEIQKKGTVIHNAVGNPLVYEAQEITTRKNKITAIGRVAKQKDYPCLLRAFKIVLDKHPEYTLEIFGNCSEKSSLDGLFAELGIEESVKFMGAQQDAILKAADSACYVMSSLHEGMPNALMEAMAVGLPCVSTDCPNGPAELITNGENGLLVPVGDYEKLAEAILEMIEDKDFAEMCGKNAKKILETHSVEIKAKEYMDYILKIYNEE